MRRLLLILLLFATPLQWSWAGGLSWHERPCPCGSQPPADPSVVPAEGGALVAPDAAADASTGDAATDGCCDADCTHCQGQVAPGLIASPVRLATPAPDRVTGGDTRRCPAPLPDELLRPPRASPR
jgi:hypothetical protein